MSTSWIIDTLIPLLAVLTMPSRSFSSCTSAGNVMNLVLSVNLISLRPTLLACCFSAIRWSLAESESPMHIQRCRQFDLGRLHNQMDCLIHKTDKNCRLSLMKPKCPQNVGRLSRPYSFNGRAAYGLHPTVQCRR